MPTPSLPWFKVWIGATSHGKVRQLNDALFRTWVELLDATAQQPVRGRFKSAREAASIVRRPVAHVKLLIASGLIDETPDGLTMHDWDAWQRWRKEDVNNTGSTHDQHTKDSGMTPESPPDQLTINTRSPTMDDSLPLPSLHSSLSLSEERDVDGEEEEELRPENPRAPSGRPPSVNGAANGYLHTPKGSGPMKDAFAAIGLGEVVFTARDHSAIKHSDAAPALVAEVYDQVARCEYGDDFMRRRLSVHEAIEWVNGYVEWKAERDWRAGADPIDAVFGKRE